MRFAVFVCAALCLSTVILTFAQNESISVTSVSVWVKATDEEGNAAEGLRAEDFSIYEDDHQMPISCFEASQQTESQKRKLILVVDLYNTLHTEYFSIREAAQGFIDSLDPETWEVMLAVILASAPTQVVPFTDDLDRIYSELETMKANTFRDQEIAKRKREIVDQLKDSGSRRGGNRAMDLALFYAQDERHTAELTLKGLAAISKYMVNPEEHVFLVFLSGGINTRPGLQYLQILDKAQSQRDFDPGVVAFKNLSLMDKITKYLTPLLQKNITAYCVNTRGTVNPGLDTIREETFAYSATDPAMLSYYQEGMDEIANLTGGLSFKNTNDFEKPFAKILTETLGHYTICYKPADMTDKEKYRRIEVRTNRKGIKLRYRKGYWTSGKEE